MTNVSNSMPQETLTTAAPSAPVWPDCVEHGIWTAIPATPPTPATPNAPLSAFTLKLSDVDKTENDHIEKAGIMTFHATGCAGNYDDHTAQEQVANVMVEQIASPGALGISKGPATTASFFYHLGDVVYKPEPPAATALSGTTQALPDGTNPLPDDSLAYDEKQMVNAQFYAPYTKYNRSIFTVAGNHDGKFNKHDHKSAITHFLRNFCSQTNGVSSDNTTDKRAAMQQPYPYWRLDTPLAYFIGLYTNVANGGILDDPHNTKDAPQADWLVAQLKDLQSKNEQNNPRRAILLVLHYPPYSATANFSDRGNPQLGPTNVPPTQAQALGVVLQNAFAAANLWPDAVFCAHAHLYQRLTYTRPAVHNTTVQIPYLIVGSGGHTIEKMGAPCKKDAPEMKPPFGISYPDNGNPPPGETVTLVTYEDKHFGFLRVTITPKKLTGEYFIAYSGKKDAAPNDSKHLPRLADAFELDLNTHQVSELMTAMS